MGEASPFDSPNWEVCIISQLPGVKKSLESQTDRAPAFMDLTVSWGKKDINPKLPPQLKEVVMIPVKGKSKAILGS